MIFDRDVTYLALIDNNIICMNTSAYRAGTNLQVRLIYALEPQTIPRKGKIPSRVPSAVPVLSPRKFPTCRSSLFSLPAPANIIRVQAETHNGVAILPYNKKN